MEKEEHASCLTNLQQLLECITFQLNDEDGLTRALLAVANICNRNGDASKEHLLQKGGIQLILNVLTSTKFPKVCQSAMVTLAYASEGNYHIQNKLCDSSVFNFLRSILSTSDIEESLIHAAVYLIMNLVSNNSFGQNLMKETNCLESLMDLYIYHVKCLISPENWLEKIQPLSDKVWHSITNALGVCLNNPQNDLNQKFCCKLLPFSLKLLQNSKDSSVISTVASFLCLLIANNVYNQTLLEEEYHGLAIIVKTLCNCILYSKEDKQFYKTTIDLISVIDVAVTDNQKNSESLATLKAVSVLVSFLSHVNDTQDIIKIILTIAHCIEVQDNLISFTESNGLAVVLRHFIVIEDEEFYKIVKYLLQILDNFSGFLNIFQLPDEKVKMVDDTDKYFNMYINLEKEITQKNQNCICQKELLENPEVNQNLENSNDILTSSLENHLKNISFHHEVTPFKDETNTKHLLEKDKLNNVSTLIPLSSTPISSPHTMHNFSPLVTSPRRLSNQLTPSHNQKQEFVSQLTQNKSLTPQRNKLEKYISSQEPENSSSASKYYSLTPQSEEDICTDNLSISEVGKASEKCDINLIVEANHYSCSQTSTSDYSMDVYNFEEDSEEKDHDYIKHRKTPRKIAFRVPFSEKEVEFLKKGIETYGQDWKKILWSYDFHKSRTNVSLKDKYKQLMAKEKNKKKVRSRLKKFSQLEMNNIQKGVDLYGHDWKKINKMFKFVDRTPVNLKDKWRNMCKSYGYMD